MADVTRRVTETSTPINDGAATGVQTTREVEDPVAERDHSKDVATRVIWYITGVILVLLAARFVLALLGANPANGLANFVYSVTQPMVSPFFNLFNYNFTNGGSRFESFTLVAMAVYALIAYGIAKLFTLNRR